MGRRALPKVDDQLDLGSYLTPLRELTSWQPDEWFPRSAPLEIEVGSGKGMFITNAAFSQPEHNFVGVEIAQKYARYCASRLAKRELSNAIILQGNAEDFFNRFVPDNSVTAVHVYFPDPWWKKRHFKRRIMNDKFLPAVHRALIPAGRLHFWTDVESYFEQSRELIRRCTQFAGPFDVDQVPAVHEFDYRTHFERRMRILDQPVYRSWYRKVE